MQITDVDWRQIFNSWEVADLLYLRSIIDEKLATRPRRKIIIRKDD
jgi:hypothetical protein